MILNELHSHLIIRVELIVNRLIAALLIFFVDKIHNNFRPGGCRFEDVVLDIWVIVFVVLRFIVFVGN